MQTSVIITKVARILKVSEARVMIYEKGHDQPEYHIPISKKLKLTGGLNKVSFNCTNKVSISTIDVKKYTESLITIYK